MTDRIQRLRQESFNAQPSLSIERAPINTAKGHKVQVFVDNGSVELFVDGGRIAMTNLVFPNEPYNSLRFYSEGGEMKISDFTIYKLGL